MIVGIMQPYFFPYLGYWQLIKAVDKYVVYDDVTYIKGGWISRNNILLNKQAHMLTIPLSQASSFKNINEIDVTTDIKAREKVLKTIETAYKKAPYYSRVYPAVSEIIRNTKTIADLNYKGILFVKEYLGLSTKIILSSEMKKNNDLKGQEKVIHINNILGSDTYYNAIGGIELYDAESFRRNGIRLFFLKMNSVKYQQFGNEYVPNLSIIDVLMFNDSDEVNQLLDKFTLIEGK